MVKETKDLFPKKIARMFSIMKAMHKYPVSKYKVRKLIPQTVRLKKYRETVVRAVQAYRKWLMEEVKKRETSKT